MLVQTSTRKSSVPQLASAAFLTMPLSNIQVCISNCSFRLSDPAVGLPLMIRQ